MENRLQFIYGELHNQQSVGEGAPHSRGVDHFWIGLDKKAILAELFGSPLECLPAGTIRALSLIIT